MLSLSNQLRDKTKHEAVKETCQRIDERTEMWLTPDQEVLFFFALQGVVLSIKRWVNLFNLDSDQHPISPDSNTAKSFIDTTKIIERNFCVMRKIKT